MLGWNGNRGELSRDIDALGVAVNGDNDHTGLSSRLTSMEKQFKRWERLHWVLLAAVVGSLATNVVSLVFAK
jgi:hypothetical protein